VVDRPRIRWALDPGRPASLTLVTAPAGYGKTTAVRDCCAGLDAAVAWVTLDDSDNDPALLWRYVATALDRVRWGLGQRALRRLAVAGSPVEVAVDELMNAIGSLESGAVVVLDDLPVTATSRRCTCIPTHTPGITRAPSQSP
jgi:LuxR family transcriptional regulator, maltose regulon positive regulatory protein